ncbi:MAG TPA: cupin domain-containing protein, partial [Ohtaekwangia sp.]|nr:cupin domain-containing protein [Ohtaekwangia sp.]
MSQNLLAAAMEVTLLTISPDATRRPTTADGFEFKYIISGRCDYHINEEVIPLEEGDALYFDASAPHIPVNKTDKNVVMLAMYFIVTKV